MRTDTHGRTAAVLLLTLTGALVGCSPDGLLNNEPFPPSVTDPAILETPAGALAAYQGVLAQFRIAFGGATDYTGSTFVGISGLLTDELQDGVLFNQGMVSPDSIDRRAMSPAATELRSGQVYSELQKVRGQANQALGLLRDYLSDQPGRQSHVYALEGYAELFLAELFCSGIPLSTLDYHGDYTLKPGSTTDEVLAHAAALFDSALARATEPRMADLARVGKARTLLNRGAYADAAAAVSGVADDYVYTVHYGAAASTTDNQRNFAVTLSGFSFVDWAFSVADHESLNGLNYISSGDPRTAVRDLTFGRKHPLKYATDGSSPIVLASGLEARLIEAEAALQAKDYAAWLDKLNYLRQTETFWGQIVPNPGGPLPALDDPGATISDPAAADSARVDLLFRERAFWLFLTGHRQGDLRRILRDPQYRQYWRTQDQLYPSGAYFGGGIYGGDVNFPVPAAERNTNPLFTGCASRGA